MGINEQIEIWREQNNLIELHLIASRNQHRWIYGRIFSFDKEKQQILFYNDDTKTVENIRLTEIEDARVATTDQTDR